MPRIRRQSIEDLKHRVNIHDVVSPIVSLKRSGRNFVGLSPFTNEKSPSFFVLPDKNIFKCFSSGLAGDVIRFVEETEKLTFTEAVEALAERFNITLEYEDGAGPAGPDRSLKRELLDIHEYAADFYHRALLAPHPESEAVRDYWTTRRSFPLEVARDFKIGYAPAETGKLQEVLLKQGFSNEALRECGLFYARENQPHPAMWRPRFRGRLMIPIRDVQGAIIAFTARQLAQTPPDDPTREAKYVNSPETPLFHKSRVLFNLDRARTAVEAAHGFLMVEGQLDAIRCWSAGFASAVAPQGTSVTEDQLRLLRRYHPRLDVVLDGDPAGQRAALRVLPLALRAGLEVRFVALVGGKDPDEVLLGPDGKAAFERLRDEADDPMRFATRALLPHAETASPREKADALKQLGAILAEADSEVARQEYLRLACAYWGIDQAAATRDLKKGAGPARTARSEASVEKKPLTSPERSLLWCVLRNPRWGLAVPSDVHDWIDHHLLEGTLLARVVADIQESGIPDTVNLDVWPETTAERDCLYAVYAEEHPNADESRLAKDAVLHLARRHYRERMRGLSEHLARPGLSAEDTRVGLEEFRRLKRDELSLDAVLSRHFAQTHS